jgi:hypothetical protein
VLRLDHDGAGRNDSGDGLQACCAHRLSRLDEIDNAVGHAERARCLNTSADVLDVCLELRIAICFAARLLGFQLPEVLLGEVCEARYDVLADEVFRLGQAALLRYLHLQIALAEVEVKDLYNAGCLCGRVCALVLLDLVAARDSQIDTAFTNESGDVGGGEKDQRKRVVLDEGNVKARVAVELDVGAVKEVEACLVEAALCWSCQSLSAASACVYNVLLGTAKSSRSFKLLPKMSVRNGKLLLPARARMAISSTALTPLMSPIVSSIVAGRGCGKDVVHVRVD